MQTMVVLALGMMLSAQADETSKVAQQYAALATADEAKASRALLALASQPTEAVELLNKRLKAVKVDTKQVTKWIEQLGDESFSVREDAARELAYLSVFVRSHLEKAVESAKDAEVKKRLDVLLNQLPDTKKKEMQPPLRGNVSISNVNGKLTIKIDGKELNLNPPPAEAPKPNLSLLQVTRSIALLEHIGTPAARKVLKRLADGEADSTVTKEAKAALARLGEK